MKYFNLFLMVCVVFFITSCFNKEEVYTNWSDNNYKTTTDITVGLSSQYSKTYYSKLADAMKQYWIVNFSDQMNYQDYVNEVAKQTDNFNPEKTISFLVPNKEERTKVLKSIKVYNYIKYLDTSSVFQKFSLIDYCFYSDNTKLINFNNNKLIYTIAGLLTEDGELPSEYEIEQITKDVSFIMNLNMFSMQKKCLIIDKLQSKYGLKYNEIKKLGLD